MVSVRARRIAAVVSLAIGIAQALDSGIRHSSPMSIALVATALSVVAAALWWSSRTRWHLMAVAVGMALLVVARIVSPVPLPTLVFAGWIPAILIFFLTARSKTGASVLLFAVVSTGMAPLEAGAWVPARQTSSTRTVCYDGEVGSGPKLRRAILVVQSDAARTITSADLELHGRPVRSIPLRAPATADGTFHAVARDPAVQIEVRLPALREGEDARGTITIGRDVSDIRLRPSRATPEADWVLGDWRGSVPFARLNLHVGRGPCGLLIGTFDSPDQGQAGLPMTGVGVSSNTVTFEARYLDLAVSLTRHNDRSLAGEVTQGGIPTPFAVKRGAWSSAKRPQDPTPPYPYDEREARFESRTRGIQLTGTLTVPRGAGPAPALVLISGSGAQDRDERVAGHRPFLVLADDLTRRGYAVLRIDDRGVGGSSGDVLTAGLDEVAADILGALDWVRGQPGIDRDRIGVLGRSEGRYVAPMVAARDAGVRFVILLAGPTLRGRDMLLAQRASMAIAAGDPAETRQLDIMWLQRIFGVLDSRPSDDDLEARVQSATSSWLAELPASRRPAAEAMIARRTAAQDAASLALWRTAWFKSLYHYDPRPTLAGLRIPILAIYGDLDWQVPADQSAQALETALGAAGLERATIARLRGVNHMMQRATTGLMEEYAEIDETIAPQVLREIGEFLARVAPASNDVARVAGRCQLWHCPAERGAVAAGRPAWTSASRTAAAAPGSTGRH
jgi:pimeloyl-ACP methyl ester carboxylesterase